jgi:glycosyltransferase involved in cell wall biosynthesis
LISIVIRAKNEEQYLGEVIRALLAQDESEEFEILVLDSGSTDRTLEIARSLLVRIEEIPARSFTFGRALNLGMKLTHGPIIVYISAHCTPTTHAWLRELVTPLRQEPTTVATYGRQEPRPGINPFEEGGLYNAFPADTSRSPAALFSNANCAIRRHVLEAKPFDEALEFAEDLVWRLQFKSQQICYVPSASVYHTHPLNLRYWSRRFHSDAVASMRMKQTYGINNPYIRFHSGLQSVLRDFLGGAFHQLRYFRQRGYYRMMPLIPVFEGIRTLNFAKGMRAGRRLLKCENEGVLGETVQSDRRERASG